MFQGPQAWIRGEVVLPGKMKTNRQGEDDFAIIPHDIGNNGSMADEHECGIVHPNC